MIHGLDGYLWALAAVAAGVAVWPFVARRDARWAGGLSAMVPALLFVILVFQVPGVGAGELPRWSADWVPELGVRLDFLLDGTGLLLALLVSGIGALILVYGGGYLNGHKRVGAFFAYIHLFMFAMLGLAAADHLIVFFTFWELTSLASYLLIGLMHEQLDARKAALRALLVTGFGGVAMLAGFVLLGHVAGTWKISEIATMGPQVLAHPYANAILGLILLGAFTKSAQIPFHFWLPGAMAAPTPVSAYLHSATMVKAGIFLLAKMFPVFGQSATWSAVLLPVGALTMLCGALFALAQTDLKRLLAYSTMSALGTLVLLLGIGTDLAVKAAMVFMVVHALYKAALFMVAGAVDKATGTRDVTQLHGLGARLPLLAFAAALAAFSMSGVPPFIGFIGKELLYEAKVHAGGFGPLVVICGFAANAVNVTIALKVGYSPFVQRGPLPDIYPKARHPALLAGPLLLAIAGAVIGLWPDLIGKDLIAAAVRDVTAHPADVHLKLWHGFNMVLLLSVITVLAGSALFVFRERVRAMVAMLLSRVPTRAVGLFDQILSAVITRAGRITWFFQHGNLRGYFVALLLSLVAIVAAAVVSANPAFDIRVGPLRFLPTGVAIMMAAAAMVAAHAASRMTALLALGGVGYGVCLLFVLFGAPDLALTQVLVETLTLVLFAFILGRLPPIREVSSRPRRMADMVVAAAVGLVVTVSVLVVRSAPAPEAPVSLPMAQWSLPIAQGKNVVNVILVDFRALDTLGEISVLAIAALGVAGLLHGARVARRTGEVVPPSPLYRAAVSMVVPALLALAVWLLLRGHNDPGGGFAGGLVAAAALVLRQLGQDNAAQRTGRHPIWLVVIGLSIALASSLPAYFVGQAYFTGVWFGSIWLPFVGTTKLGTPFVFDIGVFFVVFGVGRWILASLLEAADSTAVAREH